MSTQAANPAEFMAHVDRIEPVGGEINTWYDSYRNKGQSGWAR